MKYYIFIPVLFILIFSCKIQQPPEPRYVDYVPFFDQTGMEFLKSPSPRGAKLDTSVCVWSNLRQEKALINETLYIEQDLEPVEAELIIDIELINEKPPLLDTVLIVTEILFTAKMVDTYFPVVPDTFISDLMFLYDSAQNILADHESTSISNFKLIKPLDPDTSWKPLTVADSLMYNDSLVILDEHFDHEMQTKHQYNASAIKRQDSLLKNVENDTARIQIIQKKLFYSNNEILTDSTRDLLDAVTIMNGLLADLGYLVGDTIKLTDDFQAMQLDSFIFVKTKTDIIEIIDSSRIVKQRPVEELMKEVICNAVVEDTISIRGEIVFKVFYPRENDIFIDMVRVRGGSFQMGNNNFGTGEIIDYSGKNANTQNRRFDEDERPAYSIDVSSFLISKYEITNTLYASFLSLAGCDSLGFIGHLRLIDLGSRDTKIHWDTYKWRFIPVKGYENYPVVNVTWDGAQYFCYFMGRGRLPSEAEWEYAAKGGIYALRYYTDKRMGTYEYYHKYAGSNTMNEVGWFVDNSRGYCHKVGEKKANLLGIHDMSGNVWEWCYDKYNAEFYKRNDESHDPMCLTGPGVRVNRGGSWSNDATYCRVCNRNFLIQGGSNKFLGFRYLRK